MNNVVVADTGPLIALALVKLLPTLSNLFAEVLVPPSVLAEATEDLSKPGAQAIKLALENGLIKLRPVEVSSSFSPNPLDGALYRFSDPQDDSCH